MVDHVHIQQWIDRAREILNEQASDESVRWHPPTTEHLLTVEAEQLYANSDGISDEAAALQIATMVRIWWATEGRRLV